MADETSAAFGVYPHLRARRSKQDRTAAADAPLSVLRGWAAGTAGLPGDIESIVRMLPFIERKESILPTSDFYKEWLPGAALNETPLGKVATELGSATGGTGVGALSKLAAQGVKAGGRHAAAAVHQAMMNPDSALLRAAQPMFVVKPKGGNWLAGSVEESLGGLKADLPQEAARQTMQGVGLANHDRASALNSWIDKTLARYVKNEMATPEDPVGAPRYLSADDAIDLLTPKQGYASGGLVQGDYDPTRIDARVAELRAELAL